MSKFYADGHRALQDRFDARRMADLMENAIVHAEFQEHEVKFIETRNMLFLSTIDSSGRPTVSYKGGAPGFVRVTGSSSLLFPNYDGNGMYYSLGNIVHAPRIGLLFIDFETPNRLRVQGSAELCFDHPMLERFPGAQLLISVTVESIWVNCPRYIHPHKVVEQSRYAPAAGQEAPVPAWKRIDVVQDALPTRDRARTADAGGEITQEEYAELLAKGEA
jgi:predicted pyridoxine 5'-phosphate oxidase superfamily flavin-nucleotide-binding protein